MVEKAKKDWIREGENYHKNENYKKAVECFDNALSIDPNDWQIWHLKGFSLYYLENYSEALKCYTEASQLVPGDSIISHEYRSLKWRLIFLNLILENMEYEGIQESVRFFGDENAVYKKIPSLLSKDCTPKEASDAYDLALGKFPEDRELLEGKTNLLYDLGRYEEVLAFHDGRYLSDDRCQELARKCFDKGYLKQALKYFARATNMPENSLLLDELEGILKELDEKKRKKSFTELLEKGILRPEFYEWEFQKYLKEEIDIIEIIENRKFGFLIDKLEEKIEDEDFPYLYMALVRYLKKKKDSDPEGIEKEFTEIKRKIKHEESVLGSYEYDIAISFAGEDREIAKNLAEKLKDKLVNDRTVEVFYDEFYKSELWGKELTEHFRKVYGPYSRFVLPLISKHYPVKNWTDFEFSIMGEEAKKRKTEFILPVKLDDTKMWGIHEDVAYLDYRKEGIDGIVNCLLEKLSKPLDQEPYKGNEK